LVRTQVGTVIEGHPHRCEILWEKYIFLPFVPFVGLRLIHPAYTVAEVAWNGKLNEFETITNIDQNTDPFGLRGEDVCEGVVSEDGWNCIGYAVYEEQDWKTGKIN
jgi:hypothetical protein